ncbi:hypothetical protein Hypma_002047 [Hypsizygus marmoreus]|uniref:Uncharacterized protein n=1 Tax=Hypsizygus marmoreus TaxID=39966 RepID=A0A369J4Q9_HYPMA|nr:hypothetical protein Hypma_002047 [Hypsizygus marmoreus]
MHALITHHDELNCKRRNVTGDARQRQQDYVWLRRRQGGHRAQHTTHLKDVRMQRLLDAQQWAGQAVKGTDAHRSV